LTFCTPDSVDKLVADLKKRPEIEEAYAMRTGRPPADTARVASSSSVNAYLGAVNQSPLLFRGLDFNGCKSYPGGTGSGIKIVDIEAGWDYNYSGNTPTTLDHVALPSTIQHLLGGTDDTNGWKYHGMNVMGIIFMNPRVSIDGSGVATGGQGYTMGIKFQYPIDATTNAPADPRFNAGLSPSINIANAIKEAITSNPANPAALLGAGDVLLLEYQIENGGIDDYPVESDPAVYTIIQTAVALGVTVVEPAGNGNHDLDATPGFDRTVQDSGAILVAASDSTLLGPWSPDPNQGTNYGSRIDVFAWGQDVSTTGADHDDDSTDQSTAYCPDGDDPNPFGGTSAASAIIAGAAMVVQGIAKQKLGDPFSPSQLRALFTNYGTPSGINDPDPTRPNPANGKIGVMPNLSSLINSFMQLDDRNHPEGRPHGIHGSGGPPAVVSPTPSTTPPISGPSR
jgi:serine protease